MMRLCAAPQRVSGACGPMLASGRRALRRGQTGSIRAVADLPIKEGYADFRGHRTWYRVTGDLGAGKRPLVTLHGGPGAAHDYLDRFGQLAKAGRAVVHYDQLGGGRS